MPAFTFTSPDQKKYTVNGPEGATEGQAFEILQKQLGTQDPTAGLPPEKTESSAFQRYVGGPAEALTSAVTGAVAAPIGAAAGLYRGLTGGKYGTPEGVREAGQRASEVSRNLTYEPRSAEGKEALEYVGKKFDQSKLAGLGPTEAIGLAGTPARSAASAAGKALAPEAELLKKIPGKLADVVTPKPSPEIAALAKKAEAMGIELRPDMLSNNRIAKMIGEALEQVPLSGSKAEQRQIAFNSALTKIIGGDNRSKRLTPDVFDRAMTESGEKIGQISKETPIRVDNDLRQKFSSRVQEVDKFETADVSKIVKNYVTEMSSAIGPDGSIPGETFRKINSKIGRQIRSTNNGDLKNALYELQEDMHDALEKNIGSNVRLEELKDARFKYAMGKIIEPLVAKAKGGDISPAALMGAVTSDSSKKTMMARGRGGEIGDLARIGQAFLKEPPSSGTGERLGAYSLLTGGAIAEPHTAAAIVGGANLYNRLGPRITKRAINMRDIDPQATTPWNIGQP